MKTRLHTVHDKGIKYPLLMFACPGCIAGGPAGYGGIHDLPVNTKGLHKPAWDWNGNLELPTLSPSILSQGHCRCHSFLKDGVFEFLTDSDHPLAGQKVPIPDLPQWVEEL